MSRSQHDSPNFCHFYSFPLDKPKKPRPSQKRSVTRPTFLSSQPSSSSSEGCSRAWRSRPSEVHSLSLDSLSFVQEAAVDPLDAYFNLSSPELTAPDKSSAERYYPAPSPSYVLEDGPSVDAVRKERRKQQNRNAQRNYRNRQELIVQSLRQECAQLRQENEKLKQGIVQSESEVNTMNWCWSTADFVPLEPYGFDDGDMFAGGACRTGH